MMSVWDSGAGGSVRNRGSGDGMGRYGVGLGSGVGGSSSSGKVAGACLVIVFAFDCCGCDGECCEFFSADYCDFGFFADYVVCQ
jgi:hypothetical protein